MSTPIPILHVSVTEAARISGLSRSSLYELLGSNAIRSIRVGRRRLIDVESIKAWSKSFTANEGLNTRKEGAL